MVKIITAIEIERLGETLEDCFSLAKAEDDLALMVDIADAMQLLTALRGARVEEVIS